MLSLVRKEIHFLLHEHVQELEERGGGKTHNIVVVALDLTNQHTAQALYNRQNKRHNRVLFRVKDTPV